MCVFIIIIYLKDLEFKGYGIFRKYGIWDIKHYFGILKKNGDVGYFKALDWFILYPYVQNHECC